MSKVVIEYVNDVVTIVESGIPGAAGPRNIIQESGGPTTLTVGAVADGEFLKRVGSTVVGAAGGGGGGAGTVTSVAVTGSTGLTVGGSPITTSGTITLTLSANLQSWSAILPAAKFDAAGVSAFGATLIDDADASAARTTLGLVIGTNVQAYDADLATWAGVTPGTGVATALAVNVGSAGAPVVNGGALGTPSSGVATNLTGTASGLTAGNVTTNANLTGHVTSTGNAAVLGSFTLAQLNTAISDGDVLPLAGGTMSGAIACADNEIQRATFLDTAHKTQAKGSISGAQTIDLTAGSSVTATASGAITWTFSNPSPSGTECAIFLTLTNGGVGAQTWPASVDWDATAGAPTLTASGIDKLLFVTNDAGTRWDGFLCGKGMV